MRRWAWFAAGAIAGVFAAFVVWIFLGEDRS